MAPFFKAGGRITAGDVHFVEQAGEDSDTDPLLVPAGDTEFARDAAFGYRSSNLVDWIREKSAGAVGGLQEPAATERVTSVSLEDLREGGPAAVRKRLAEANGGCVVVNAVEERDLQVRLRGGNPTGNILKAWSWRLPRISLPFFRLRCYVFLHGNFLSVAGVWLPIGEPLTARGRGLQPADCEYALRL